MKILEGEFADKTAEEIVADTLLQHKNNPVDALDYLNNITKGFDGFKLPAETKKQIQKANDMLSQQILTDSKQEVTTDQLPSEEVTLSVYSQAKQNPVEVSLQVTGPNDSRLINAVKQLQQKYPKRPIHLNSKSWHKTFYENANEDYKVYAIGIGLDDLKFTDEFLAGTLPIAMTLGENLYASGKYYLIIIEQNSNEIASYTGPDRGWKLEQDTNTIEEANSPLKNNFIGSTFLGAVLGIDPALLFSAGNDINSILTTKKRSAKKEAIGPIDTEKNGKSYVDLDREKHELSQREQYELHGIHPEMGENRPVKWHCTFAEPEIKKMLNDEGKAEVLLALDGIEVQDPNTPSDEDIVLLRRYFPDHYTLKGNVSYKRDDNPNRDIRISVGTFKDMIRHPANVEIFQKFIKSHPEDLNALHDFDKLTTQILDAKYPEWEYKYKDKYHLEDFSAIEKLKIYAAWKDANPTTMYKDGHELTPEEVNKTFRAPKLQKQLDKLINDKTILNQINNILLNLPEEDKSEIQEQLLTILNNWYSTQEDATTLEATLKEFIKNVPLAKVWEAKINKLYKTKISDKGILVDVRNKLKNSPDLASFNLDIADFMNSRIDKRTGIPLATGVDTKNEITRIAKKYLISTNKILQTADTTAPDFVKLIVGIKRYIEVIAKESVTKANAVKSAFDELIKECHRKNIQGSELTTVLYDWFNRLKSLKAHRLDASELKKALQPQVKPRDTSYDDWKKKVYDIFKVKINDIEAKINKQGKYKSWHSNSKGLTSHATEYRQLFEELLTALYKKYPEGTEGEISKALDDFYEMLKDETQVPNTITKKLLSII